MRKSERRWVESVGVCASVFMFDVYIDVRVL